MSTFAVETYLSRHARGEPEATAGRVMAAIASAAAGDRVEHVLSVFVPDDESCLLIFEAASAEAVRAVIAGAGLDPIRVSPARATEGDAP